MPNPKEEKKCCEGCNGTGKYPYEMYKGLKCINCDSTGFIESTTPTPTTEKSLTDIVNPLSEHCKPLTNTMEERFDKKFAKYPINLNPEVGQSSLQLDIKDFIRSEISLALKRQREEIEKLGSVVNLSLGDTEYVSKKEVLEVLSK